MINRHSHSGWLTVVLLVTLLTLGNAGSLVAAELINIGVDFEAGTYTVRLEVEMDVTAEQVKEILTSYSQYHRMAPSIKESRVLASADDGIVRVFTYMESCVLFFCRGITRVEDIHQSDSGDLMAVIVPEQSDFKNGTALWRITALGERTLLIYEASMQPGFFIPPVIGSYLVKQKLKDELLVSINRIECCAGSQVWMSENSADKAPGNSKRPGSSC